MTTTASEEPLGYGRAVKTNLSFAEAVDRARAQLKEEGFGILCDIDVAATMREKLGESFRPYRILGACNPQLALRALSSDLGVGLLLPCNVVVREEPDGSVDVSFMDPAIMVKLTESPELRAVATQARAKLVRARDALAGAR